MKRAALGGPPRLCYCVAVEGWLRRLGPLWIVIGCAVGYLPVVVPLVLWWLIFGNAPRGDPGVVVRRSRKQSDLVGNRRLSPRNAA